MTGKTVLLSSGMSSYEELQEAVDFVQSHGNELVLFQCTTAYPTQAKDWGLNVIGELKEKFDLPIGFSDHSGGITACTAAAALGASYFEFHVVFDKRMFGPDAKASLTIDESKALCTAIREVENSLKHPIDKKDNSRFMELKGIFEKSLAINRDMKAGEILQFADLEGKKPKGYGVNASQFQKVIGKKINQDLRAWSFLKEENLSDE